MTFSDDFWRRHALKALMRGHVSGPFSGMGTIAGGGGTDTILRRRMVNALLGVQQKRRIFVSYHHAGDQAYYDAFTTTFHDTYDVVYDNSLERKIDSDDVDYVCRRIFENHIKGSSCTIVLVGRNTWGRKYVDWEIDATLEKQYGLIGVLLPTTPISWDSTVRTPGRLHDNIVSGYAVWVTWAQLTQSTTALQGLIEAANTSAKNLKDLINNTRDRRYRNEPLQ